MMLVAVILDYYCQGGCGRHRGIKKDGTMYQYCSHECHQNAAQIRNVHSQVNDQWTNSQQGSSQQAHYQSRQKSVSVNDFPWDAILFYDKDQSHYEFTNFYMCRIKINEDNWPTTEHYFQAQKFIGTPYYYDIRDVPSPRQALEMSRRPDVSKWKRTDWKSIKDQIMLKALLVKFLQHKDLMVRLVKTGSRMLVENSPSDWYWGIGRDGKGENRLGKLLMHVREICCNKPTQRDQETVGDLIDLSDGNGKDEQDLQQENSQDFTNYPGVPNEIISNTNQETTPMETN